MSHISKVYIQIRNLAALKSAVANLGGVWVENKKTYNWWGRSMGDSPIPEGMTKEMLGKCDHVIQTPGGNYEIGVVKMPDGTYTLAYDSYNYGKGPNGIKADGQKLIDRFGDGLKKLTQRYAATLATMAARAKGWMTTEQTLPNGSIQILATGMK